MQWFRISRGEKIVIALIVAVTAALLVTSRQQSLCVADPPADLKSNRPK